MKYRVAFRERTTASGSAAEEPSEYVDFDLPEGVVLDASMVERIEPDGLHSEESLDEDDDFMNIGSEVWEYDIAPGREEEFIAAVQNSQMVMETEVMDEVGDD